MSAPCKVLVPTSDHSYQFVQLDLKEVVVSSDGSYREWGGSYDYLEDDEKLVQRWVAE